MIINNYLWDDVDFHKTFTPQEQYITKIMELADKEYIGTKEDISEVTGIPTGKTSGKVIPHIRYAKFFGLIEYVKEGAKFSLSLTDLGRVVYKEDKYLFEKATKLICHYNISDEMDGALIWQFMYYGFPFRFDEEIGLNLINKRKEEVFGREVKLDVIRKTYMDEFMKSTNLIEFEDYVIFNSQIAESQYTKLYGYLLLKSWEKYLPKENEITMGQLIEKFSWGKRLGFMEDEIMGVLDDLSDEGYVKLNKQLHPCTIIKTETSENIVDKIYSDLL